jgi:hypothetical protein
VFALATVAVLDDIGELRLHLRLKSLTNPTLVPGQNAAASAGDGGDKLDSESEEAKDGGGPKHVGSACVFKAPVEITADGWSRVELSVTGTMATLKFNGKPVGPAGGIIDVSGPKTAPGGTKSYLPKSGFAALGGGPDYSTTLSFDNFTVNKPASGGPGGSICGGRVPAAGMTVVGVACGLDVPGLAFDIVGNRIMPRSNHSLCITNVNSSSLELQKCKAGPDATQDFIYNRALATIVLAAAPPPPPDSPWDHFTPGQGVPYGKPYSGTKGVTLTATRHLSKNHVSLVDLAGTYKSYSFCHHED